jgi:protein-L-isoaspartate(D-aspartate) O-methyltransferase
MTASDMSRVRRDFADRIAALAQLKSSDLVEALANVPREDFVGPGPWKVMRPPFTGGYVDTPNADPVHLYDTVVVALEADPDLADVAIQKLATYVNVEVRCDRSPTPGDGKFDAVFVNAGATEVVPLWLDRLAEGGRLLVPLTTTRSMTGAGGNQIGVGHMLRVTRQTDRYVAGFISPVGVFHCIGARTDRGEQILRMAYRRGDLNTVRSLRLDSHNEQSTCWLHGSSFCLSRTA